MIFETNEFARAVFFFDGDGHISKEMHIAEFQAVLDGFVPLADLAGMKARGCYIEADGQLHAQRLVFFKIEIMASGEISRSWHLPLMDLAAAAPKGKDLGGGAIRLCCHSQCPAEHYRSSLWDPDLSPTNNHLNAIKNALQRNKIGIQFREVEEDRQALSSDQQAKVEQEISERLRREYAKEFRDHMAQLLKEQRLRISTSRSDFKDESRSIKVDYEARIQEYKNLLLEKDRMLDDQRGLNATLKNTVDGQAQKLSAMREYFDLKLEEAKDVDSGQVDAIRTAIEAEFTAKFEAETKDLNESLQMREVELLYRNEREVQMRDELVRLREANQHAVANTGEQLLFKLAEKGVAFVSFQPGAGHLTIPVSDIAVYLESPTAYAAQQSGVDELCYTQWLDHYRMPVCLNEIESGRMCGQNIERVESPLDFKFGESDCCQSCQKKKARPHLRLAGV